MLLAHLSARVESFFPGTALPRFNRRAGVRFLLAFIVALLAAVSSRGAEIRWTVLGQCEANAEGVFFSQLAAPNSVVPAPHVRLFDAPAFGQVMSLTHTQIWAAFHAAFPDAGPEVRLNGPATIRVSRRARTLTEVELKELLTMTLQREQVRQKGELELRFTRPWKTIVIPDDSLQVKILDLPNVGVSPNFIVRFELATARETVGTWHLPLQARVWKDLWVARSGLQRGELLASADIARERRDVLSIREAVLEQETLNPTMEVAQAINAGAPITTRSVKVRPVVRRGQIVDAQLQQGAVVISLKVEALQEGAPGDSIRVRNVQSKREFLGKVHDDQTIQVVF